MSNEPEWIDAVKMSRQIKAETGEELSKMTPEEQIRFLNDFARNHPVVGKKLRSPYGQRPIKDA